MKIKTLLYALSTAVILSSALPCGTAYAAESGIFITTKPAPAEADEYAFEQFCFFPQSDWDMWGYGSASDLGISHGYMVKDYMSGEYADGYFYLIMNGDTAVGITHVLQVDGNYTITAGIPAPEGINEIETSEEAPALMVASEDTLYAVTPSYIYTLDKYTPTNYKRIQSEISAIMNSNIMPEPSSDETVIRISADNQIGQNDPSLKTLNGKIYYINPDGTYAKGWKTIDGAKYYFGSDGAAYVQNSEIDGIRYRFDKTGRCRGEFTGWLKKSDKYYLYWDGIAQKGKWFDLNGKRYYLLRDGSRATGKYKISGTIYEFDENGILI